MINSHCYHFELLEFQNGIFDHFIDATYILTMVGSDERRKNIEKQLSLIIPTKKVYIVHNEGYKKGNKKLKKYIPPYDITDCNLHTISHSLQNNYDQILILEDDFIYSDKVKDSNIIHEIKSFLDEKKDNTLYYNLGTIPLLFYPNINPYSVYKNTVRGFFCMSAHANIYPKKIRIDMMNKVDSIYGYWDTLLTTNYENYFCKCPVFYQTYPQTDNQMNWVSTNSKIINDFSFYFIKNMMIVLGLDKKPEPGMTIVYHSLFFFNYLCVILIIFIIVYLFLSLNNIGKRSQIKMKKK
jgi:hypothetical protein